jgi:hypothetical protein
LVEGERLVIRIFHADDIGTAWVGGDVHIEGGVDTAIGEVMISSGRKVRVDVAVDGASAFVEVGAAPRTRGDGAGEYWGNAGVTRMAIVCICGRCAWT